VFYVTYDVRPKKEFYNSESRVVYKVRTEVEETVDV
jgi:hypothetical protein